MQINAEEVQRLLKDIVWKRWDEGGCHDHASLWKMVGLVDFFLPFLPLEQVHLERLFQIRLGAIAASLLHSHRVNLTWAPELIPFLYKKVKMQLSLPFPLSRLSQLLLTHVHLEQLFDIRLGAIVTGLLHSHHAQEARNGDVLIHGSQQV